MPWFSKETLKQGKSLLRPVAARIARERYGTAAGQAVDYLLGPSEDAPGASPATVVSGTRLASYLDKRYERKCGVEVKQVQNFTLGTALSTTLTHLTNPFSAISQGTNDVTRVGSSIEVKSLRLRMNVKAGAASATPSMVRLLILKQQVMQGAVPAVGSILETTSSVMSPYTLDKTRSYTILKDVVFKLGGNTQGFTNAIKSIKWDYRPKHCHQIKYLQAAATGAVSDMTYGNIAIYIMYEGTTAPTVDYYTRANYIDV